MLCYYNFFFSSIFILVIYFFVSFIWFFLFLKFIIIQYLQHRLINFRCSARVKWETRKKINLVECRIIISIELSINHHELFLISLARNFWNSHLNISFKAKTMKSICLDEGLANILISKLKPNTITLHAQWHAPLVLRILWSNLPISRRVCKSQNSYLFAVHINWMVPIGVCALRRCHMDVSRAQQNYIVDEENRI